MIKVLLLISESWNDIVHPNNNLTNWFSDFPEVEIYTISCGLDVQYNHCCKNYFCVNDAMMARSFIPGKRAGRVVRFADWPDSLLGKENINKDRIKSGIYNKKEHMHNGFFRLARDIIWRYGQYDKKALKRFIVDFKPDIIFSQRMGSVKMCRLESIVSELTTAPLVAFTGDNEFYTGVRSEDLFELIHRKWTRTWLTKMIPKYRLYYCMSNEQIKLYKEQFGANTKFLVKCGDFDLKRQHHTVNHPISLVYAGKVYAGRWKTLALILEAIKEENVSEKNIQLDIYTPDALTEEQNRTLHDDVNSFVHPAVSANQLQSIYDQSDIVLHVESLDDNDSQSTKYSFSTKIIDCLASGCAVFAVCNKNQAGYQYLSENDIALTADNKQELSRILKQICDNASLIIDYSGKALSFGRQFHERKVVQKTIMNDFEQVISQK